MAPNLPNAQVYDLKSNEASGLVHRHSQSKTYFCHFRTSCHVCNDTLRVTVKPLEDLRFEIDVAHLGDRALPHIRAPNIGLRGFCKLLSDPLVVWIFEYSIHCPSCSQLFEVTMTPDRSRGMVFSTRSSTATKDRPRRLQVWTFPFEVQWAIWRATGGSKFIFTLDAGTMVADQMLEFWRRASPQAPWQSISDTWGAQRPDLNDAPEAVRVSWAHQFPPLVARTPQDYRREDFSPMEPATFNEREIPARSDPTHTGSRDRSSARTLWLCTD